LKALKKILEENKIDAVLPTMGGQTALNLAKEAEDLGVWKQHNVRLIGVDIKAIEKAEGP
jgi:carbamoyl-phosphate synthase large subunit